MEATIPSSTRPGSGGDRSLEVRVRYLQSRFQDLAAYIDAMERLIEEFESDEGFFAELEDRIERIDDRLVALETDGARREERLAEHAERLEDLQGSLEAHRNAVTEEVETVSRDLATLQRQHEETADRVTELVEFRTALAGALRQTPEPDPGDVESSRSGEAD